MKLEWMMFANHAEERDGLLFLSGATWDTINVISPLVGELPPGVEAVALINGSLVIRMLFHRTETNRDHSFLLTLMDQDGRELQRLEGQFHVAWSEDNPPEWDQGFNVIIGLTGMPLPQFTTYSFHLLIDGNHVGDRPFRVMRHY